MTKWIVGIVSLISALGMAIILVIPSEAGGGADGASKRPPAFYVFVRGIVPLDPKKPKVTIKFRNDLRKIIRGRWPGKDKEMLLYRGLIVEIDGKPAELLKKDLAFMRDVTPYASRRFELKENSTATLEVDLSKIYKIPEKWDQITVEPTGDFAIGLSDYTCGVILKKNGKRGEYGREPKKK